MYEGFYGLMRRPFALTPDPRFLFLTPRHREALALVEYVLSGRSGLGLLIGEAGTGKTTVLRAALCARDRERDRVVTLDNPTLTRGEFFEFLAGGFGLAPQSALSKTRVLHELAGTLAERHARGGVTGLVVDEAQSLSNELLEEIRLLANVESAGGLPLPIVLAGQPELAQRLNEPGLRQLKQRIAFRGVLEPLTLLEAADYIACRLQVAGADAGATFTGAAVQAVFAHAGGIPRTIGVVCESALIAGFAREARPIGDDVVRDVCRELDLAPAVDATAARPEATAARDEPPPTEPAMATVPDVADAPPVKPQGDDGPRAEDHAATAAGAGAKAPCAQTAFAEPPGVGSARRMLERLPFWRRRESLPLRFQTEYFTVGSQRGMLLTPVAHGARAPRRRDEP
jgi:general secretion pathway protein A